MNGSRVYPHEGPPAVELVVPLAKMLPELPFLEKRFSDPQGRGGIWYVVKIAIGKEQYGKEFCRIELEYTP